mmetsp:Transcript_3096/g.7188  ORF Transcript_3096/g.7188 Transcript_3096/m.7188 type:complete len:215 (-) Transcript_3096:2581-3225(-)
MMSSRTTTSKMSMFSGSSAVPQPPDPKNPPPKPRFRFHLISPRCAITRAGASGRRCGSSAAGSRRPAPPSASPHSTWRRRSEPRPPQVRCSSQRAAAACETRRQTLEPLDRSLHLQLHRCQQQLRCSPQFFDDSSMVKKLLLSCRRCLQWTGAPLPDPPFSPSSAVCGAALRSRKPQGLLCGPLHALQRQRPLRHVGPQKRRHGHSPQRQPPLH